MRRGASPSTPFLQSYLATLTAVDLTVEGHRLLPHSCTWDRDASLLIGCSTGDLARVVVTKEVPEEGGATRLRFRLVHAGVCDFCPSLLVLNRAALVACSRDAQLAVCPLPAPEEVPVIESFLETWITHSLGSDGLDAAPAVACASFGGSDMDTLLVSLADGRLLAAPSFSTQHQAPEFTMVMDVHAGPITGLGPVFDGRTFVSSGSDGTLRTWDLTTGQPLSKVQLGGPLTAMASLPARGLVAVGSALGQIRVLSLADPSGPVVVFRRRIHTAPVTRLCFSPLGDSLASASKDRRLFFTSLGASITPVGHVHCPEEVAELTWPDGDGGSGPLLAVLESSEVFWVNAPSPGTDVGPEMLLNAKDAGLRRMKIDSHLDCAAGALLPDGSPAMLGVGLDRSLRLYTIPKELQAWGGPKGRVHHADVRAARLPTRRNQLPCAPPHLLACATSLAPACRPRGLARKSAPRASS